MTLHRHPPEQGDLPSAARARASASAHHPQHQDGAVAPGDIAVGVIVGRASEYFEFFVYGIASVLVFPALFFPQQDRLHGILMSFAVFALGFLARRMKALRVVDPARQEDRSRAWFGATVTIADEDDNHRTLTLVGDDEQDAGKGLIGWSAPLSHALRGAAVGDLRKVTLPGGEKEWEVLEISYPEA